MSQSKTQSHRTLAIFGTQWGDEGKGKIVDLFTKQADIVCRFQGGHNAGHTLIIDGEKTVLHLIPSGILHADTICCIAGGVVVSGEKLIEEIEQLTQAGVAVDNRLFISEDCPMILPFHQAIDKAREGKKSSALGTTLNGIGPAYEDNVARRSIRAIDLFNLETLEKKFRVIADFYNFQLKHYYQLQPLITKIEWENLLILREKILPLIIDTVDYLNQAYEKDQRIILEGAQGTLLDINFGSYPFVTSSNTTVGAISTGTGLAANRIDQVLGLVKAYATRVGAGPFPTELPTDEEQQPGFQLATVGGEIGATTGRPRRCGWLDLVTLRRAIQINGISKLCITKLDVLDDFAEILVCTHYRYKGKILKSSSFNCQILTDCEPIYETLPGWQAITKGITTYSQLPDNAKKYLKFIEAQTNTTIAIVSTGADRNETIIRQTLW